MVQSQFTFLFLTPFYTFFGSLSFLFSTGCFAQYWELSDFRGAWTRPAAVANGGPVAWHYYWWRAVGEADLYGKVWLVVALSTV